MLGMGLHEFPEDLQVLHRQHLAVGERKSTRLPERLECVSGKSVERRLVDLMQSGELALSRVRLQRDLPRLDDSGLCEARRGAEKLSSTMRSFCASVQRRRRPVSNDFKTRNVMMVSKDIHTSNSCAEPIPARRSPPDAYFLDVPRSFTPTIRAESS